jgi:hypothetical protein
MIRLLRSGLRFGLGVGRQKRPRLHLQSSRLPLFGLYNLVTHGVRLCGAAFDDSHASSRTNHRMIS